MNLKTRPEKWSFCLKQLLPYDIYPQKVPSIYGWTLSRHVINDVGLRFEFGMWTTGQLVTHYPINGDPPYFCHLSGACYGKNYVSIETSLGAIGCTLTHLSALQNAYVKGYETIWLMEDDILVVEDPHQLSPLIEKLDAIVGHGKWDMLFTDNLTLTGINLNENLQKQLPILWRPDFPSFDLRKMVVKMQVGEDFLRIGSRMRFHSVIYRRSGIEKILRFYQEKNLFLPIDHEVFFVPGIVPFVINRPIVSAKETTSDTKDHYFVN